MNYVIIPILVLISFVAGGETAFYLAKADAEPEPVTVTASVGTPLTYVEAPQTMKVRWVSDPIQVREVLDEYMAQNIDKPMITGLSMIINDACVIYAFKPKYEDSREMEIFAHEALHCFGFRHE